MAVLGLDGLFWEQYKAIPRPVGTAETSAKVARTWAHGIDRNLL